MRGDVSLLTDVRRGMIGEEEPQERIAALNFSAARCIAGRVRPLMLNLAWLPPVFVWQCVHSWWCLNLSQGRWSHCRSRRSSKTCCRHDNRLALRCWLSGQCRMGVARRALLPTSGRSTPRFKNLDTSKSSHSKPCLTHDAFRPYDRAGP